jgi:hypothetical protein
MIEQESLKKTGDLVTWIWLKELLEHLKAEGMTSDESDVDEYQVVHRVKVKPWRHPDITLCMESIDNTKPVERIRDGKLISTGPHVDGLPQAFYDSADRK